VTAIGIDIGGSAIKAAVVDPASGRLLGRRARMATPAAATPAAVAAAVGRLVGRLTPHAGAPLGVTLPAVVRSGIVETAAHIDDRWIGTDAPELLAGATGRPVAVINDADAAGLAEMRFGAGRDQAGVVVMVTLGTGIGSALFTDGVLVPNTELGHLPLHHEEAEDWAAASVRTHDDLSWRTWARRLEGYLQLVERLFWPRLIIVGGGVSSRADQFLPLLHLRTGVVPAALRNDAGIVGAALIAPPP
jgi:polyphosphate glucokinase